MIIRVMTLHVLLIFSTVYAQSAFGAIETNEMDTEVEEQCGISMRVPALKNIYNQELTFDCAGSYREGRKAVLSMDFQYDPNRNSGADLISFVIENIGIEQKIRSGKNSIFHQSEKSDMPSLSAGASYSGSDCEPVTKTIISAIQGRNWHGWIAEEKFGRRRMDCKSYKQYTSRYRCIHLMIGNEVATAQVGGVCLLRKRELSLERGFSYDLFIDMLKSARFLNQ
ncbi:hypothetical protein [Paraburkholderia humisilvae]|uniref:Lysozyme inhibitor LprI N-terminal domain-containing protein n=1 Tax=Paraburkholderia humisilvae TaxID=627669 RepID=A0A6J5EC06_9BURK|nr:hypothetical protein [Paraburkholderia humisilvae]CAB3762722.1 hypothetical protein LMG29542_04436 [Paraburkholderia humisilvae]